MNQVIANSAGTQSEQVDTASADEKALNSKNLDRSLLHGIAWTGGMRFVAQGLRWASTLLLARLLSPSDYGLVGYATVYLGLISLVNELGLSAAIVQQRHLTREQIAKIGGVSAILGVTLFLVSIAGAPLVAAFFREARVQPIVAVLASTFVLKGFQVLPRALMTRELSFRPLAWIDGIEAAVLAGSTLLLAFLGHGYWSLVMGSIVGTAVGTLLAWWFRPHPMQWPSDFASIRESVFYGAHVATSRVTWYLYSHADFAVVGRMLGTVALGAYTFGWSIANIPVEKVSAVLSRVTSGVFASAQHDDAAIRRYLLSLTEGLALVTFPIAAGLALVSREFVLVLLGDQWEPAILPMALLVAYSGFRSISLLFGQVLVATGRARRNMHFGLIALLVLPVLFILGTRWGTAGVAIAWIIGYPAVFVPFAMKYTLNQIKLPWIAYGRALWPALSSTVIMMAAVLAVRFLLPDGDDTQSMAIRLVVSIAVGVLSYAAIGLGIHGQRLSAFRAVLASVRK